MDIVRILNSTCDTLKAKAGVKFVPLKVRELLSNSEDAKETFMEGVKYGCNR